MLQPRDFFEVLRRNEIEFFAGVPDSLLKSFCAYVTANVAPDHHVIAANEGGAVALGLGYHLATGKLPLIYMQNSGLGNSVNPLMSLADPDVYAVPMILLIGWRGEPGVKDEPQHRKQGRVMVPMLEAMEIPHAVLSTDLHEAQVIVENAVGHAREHSTPYAIVVRKGTFEKFALPEEDRPAYPMGREEAIKVIVDGLQSTDIVVSTTGMASRELFEYRVARGDGHGSDFLTVGGMGHASQIALGVAMQRPDRLVFCLDGDGAVLMHMGSLAINAQLNCPNFKHVVLNNGAHDSVGGQPTVGFDIDIPRVAEAVGYETVLRAEAAGEVEAGLRELRDAPGMGLLEIRVNKGSRPHLGRPTTTPLQNKEGFMAFVQ